jgi:hypothetical protein
VHLLHASAKEQRGVLEQFRRLDVAKSDSGEIPVFEVDVKVRCHSIHV